MIQPRSLEVFNSVWGKPSPMANGARRDFHRYPPPPFSCGLVPGAVPPYNTSKEVPCLLSDSLYHCTTVTKVVTQCISLSHIFPVSFPCSPHSYHSGLPSPRWSASCSAFCSSLAYLACLYQHSNRESEWKRGQKFKRYLEGSIGASLVADLIGGE